MPRPRKTAEEQERRGNPGKRGPLAIAPLAVMPALEVMPPDDMSEDAKTVWMMLAPDLIAMKILRRTDALTFAVFCESFAEYAKARRQLAREGYTYEAETIAGGKMRRVNPRFIILDRARRIILQYAAQFGLTPVDRFRVIQNLAGRGPEPIDPRGGSSSGQSTDDAERDLLEIEGETVPDEGPVGALG